MKTTPRERRRPSQFLNGIDFWAFLSIQTVLLIIFMGNVPPHPFHGTSLDLAVVDHAKPMLSAIREDAMLVTVSRDGRVFYGTNQMQPDDLPPAIRDAVRQGSERKVFLKVDARAKYDAAALVIQQVSQAGIENIGIITEQRQPRSH